MKHQVLFSLINNEKIFMNVVCCSRDWRFKDNLITCAIPVTLGLLLPGRELLEECFTLFGL